MPESSSGEKVFPASPRKRLDARKKGQVAKSPELGGALVLLTLVIFLHGQLSSGNTLNLLLGDFQTAFSFNPRTTELNLTTASLVIKQSVIWMAHLALPAMVIAAAAGLLVSVGQVGLFFAPEALVPKFERIDLGAGLKRMMGTRGIFEVLKGSLKMILIGFVCYSGINGGMADILTAAQGDLFGLLGVVGNMIWYIALKVSCVLFILAVADYCYQKYEFEKNMKMTHQEMKQEHKQQEGDPIVKQRIRQQQKAISSRRMMHDVPKADVVITNPTHYAVALKYDASSSSAPIVLAKGEDLVAQKIKEIALENGVPMVENVPLARALHAQVNVGREIPGELFQAVAEVLSFVYRTYGRAGKRANRYVRPQ